MGERKTTAGSVGLADFSQEAIKKAITAKGLQSPLFLYPSALGALSIAAIAVLGLSPAWFGLGLAGLGAGAATVGYQLGFRREQLARDYLKRMHRSLNERREYLVADLTSRMQGLGFRQGIRQLKQLQQKFGNFVEILNRTLDPQEITYGRYLGIAEQVYLSSLDNLERVCGALASVKTIDVAHIARRIDEIHSDGVVTAAEETEQNSLNQRRELKEKQVVKVEHMIAQNEQAMTQLDVTAAALTEMKTRSGQASMDMESAMTELQALVSRAAKYNRKE